jgi:hypothetical protein
MTGGASPASGEGVGVGGGGGEGVGGGEGAGVGEGLGVGLATRFCDTAATAGEGRESPVRGCSALETADTATSNTEAVNTQQTACRLPLNLCISAL